MCSASWWADLQEEDSSDAGSIQSSLAQDESMKDSLWPHKNKRRSRRVLSQRRPRASWKQFALQLILYTQMKPEIALEYVKQYVMLIFGPADYDEFTSGNGIVTMCQLRILAAAFDHIFPCGFIVVDVKFKPCEIHYWPHAAGQQYVASLSPPLPRIQIVDGYILKTQWLLPAHGYEWWLPLGRQKGLRRGLQMPLT